MQRRTFLTTVAALVAGCTGRGRLFPTPSRQRGVGFDAFRTRPTARDFVALRELGVTHVALFPFGYMPAHTEPVVRRFQGERTDWSLTDEGLLTMGRMARRAHLRVILIPTLADFVDGHWRGEVRMGDDREWTTWFASYQTFLLHYARLAEKTRAVGLSVGTELRETVQREGEWRQTIAMVRERFRGWLTYAGNWDDYDRVPWWDALDLIGVQAYFELGDARAASSAADPREHLIGAWAPIKQRMAELSSSTGRRVAFTEIGYKSHAGATALPWRWEIEGPPDLELQRAAYEAAFEAFWREPWFAGFYWWKWRPNAQSDEDYERDFTPQGKPAEEVMRRYYSAR